MSPSVALTLAIVVPLIGTVAIVCLRRAPNWRETATLTTATTLLLLIVYIASAFQSGNQIATVWWYLLPDVPIAFAVEPLGLLFALVASFLWVVTSIYSIGYMRGHGEPNQTRFYAFFAIALSCAIGIAFAANMVTLFIFYEALTLATFPLVTHRGSAEAKRAGRVYLGILLSTSIGLQLLAIVWTWQLTGSLTFTERGIMHDVDDTTAGILLLLFVFGVGKAALMPLHRWLPAAMVAPTPVSALLHAVAVVKAGVFTVLKIAIYLFGTERLATIATADWLAYAAAATILIASLVALRQDNLKARLAYSTISQLSYIVLGAMLANRWGIIGGGMHIATHAFGKITLFFCAGAIMVSAHKTEVSEMRGLGRAMPITMAAFLLGSISIIGLPPTGGLWSKWYLAVGTLHADQWILLGVLLVSSVLNVAYLLPIPIRAFFSSASPSAPEGMHEAPLPMLMALSVSALGCIVLFFYPQTFFELMTKLVVSF
ncbi:MAG: proton-conducting transporter membrane subunit [Gammaproteobacteria bacterium]|nr:proton-conducting transporter membrane subunit [Gammaproteobacteria bacterium]MDH3468427.1 proton-conducting transporter membrane subunit [Gammaproteobacteria bacterium]